MFENTPNGQLEAVNQRRTDNAMAKIKRTNNYLQTTTTEN